MNQLNAEEFYQSAIVIYRGWRARGLLMNIEDRFFTFITEIIIEVGRVLKQSPELGNANRYEPLNISKTCRQKLKDFDLDPRMFNEETKRFYKAIVAGFRRQFDRFSRDYKDNTRTKNLKTNKDRLRYYFVEMVLYNTAVIVDDSWQYFGVTYLDIRKGDVGRLVDHYLRNRYIETHKLGSLHKALHDARSVLYDVRDANRGSCWRFESSVAV